MSQLVKDVVGAMMNLPLWVAIWVNFILFPLNAVAWGFVFFDPHPIWTWVAICGVVAMGPNIVMLVAWRGLSNLMSIPHLIGWIPLQIYLGFRLFGADALSYSDDGALYGYVVALFVVNAISLIFDVKDSFAWINGDRDIIRAS